MNLLRRFLRYSKRWGVTLLTERCPRFSAILRWLALMKFLVGVDLLLGDWVRASALSSISCALKIWYYYCNVRCIIIYIWGLYTANLLPHPRTSSLLHNKWWSLHPCRLFFLQPAWSCRGSHHLQATHRIRGFPRFPCLRDCPYHRRRNNLMHKQIVYMYHGRVNHTMRRWHMSLDKCWTSESARYSYTVLHVWLKKKKKEQKKKKNKKQTKAICERTN